MKITSLSCIFLLISFQLVIAGNNKDVDTQEQIKLEDIEQDNLTSEKIKELLETQQSQNIKSSDNNEAEETSSNSHEQTRDAVQTVYAESSAEAVSASPATSGINYDGYLSLRYLTPGPAINYAPTKDYVQQQQQQQQPEIQYVPQVHENEITYTVPSRQSLVKPFIGGGAPIHPMLTPQPQYVYVQSQPGGPLGTVQQLHHHQQQPLPVTVQKTVYQQEQDQKNRGNYLQFISPSPGYLMVPYPYQVPHPQHVTQPLPPPILPSVSPSSVITYSQGETGSSSLVHTSTARPYISYAPSFPSSGSPAPPILPIRYHTPTKYTTSIEPQLILGPISLPPTIEYSSHPSNHQPGYGLRFTPTPSPFSFEGLTNFLKRPMDHLIQAASGIMPRHKPAPIYSSYPSSFTSSYTGPLKNYNTIAYSVPYTPSKMFLKRETLKRSDTKKKE